MALGERPAALTAADLTGDGFPELLVGTTSTFGVANLTVLKNSGTWIASAPLPATTTTLTSSATTLAAGQALNLSATVVANAGSTIPGGTVSFLDGTTNLGTETLNAAGTATLSITTLAAGSHPLTASYDGNASFGGSGSAATTVTVTAGTPDFTIALSPTAGSVTAGQSAQTTISLASVSGFSQAVALSCTGLPTGASCQSSSASVTVGGAAATSTLTIRTAAMSASNATVGSQGPLAPGGVLLAGLALPFLVRTRKSAANWARNTALLTIMIGAGALHGCGGGDSGSAGGRSQRAHTRSMSGRRQGRLCTRRRIR